MEDAPLKIEVEVKKTKKEDPNPDKLISGHNEIILNRGADLNEVIEQIDPFFKYRLITIDNERVDRLDKLELDRKILTFDEKIEGKSQWVFKGPCDCLDENCKTSYVVFSSEAYDFMSNPSLAEFLPSLDEDDESNSSSSDSSSDSDSTCSTCGKCSGCSECSGEQQKKKKEDRKEETKTNGATGTFDVSSSSSSSNFSPVEKTPEPASAEILTDGWSNSRSSDSIAGSLGKKRKNKMKIPLNVDTGPDTTYIPK